jgi:hypothetical protein
VRYQSPSVNACVIEGERERGIGGEKGGTFRGGLRGLVEAWVAWRQEGRGGREWGTDLCFHTASRRKVLSKSEDGSSGKAVTFESFWESGYIVMGCHDVEGGWGGKEIRGREEHGQGVGLGGGSTTSRRFCCSPSWS